MVSSRSFVFAVAAVTLAAAPGAHAARFLSTQSASACTRLSCFSDSGAFKQSFAASTFDGPTRINSFMLKRGLMGRFANSTFKVTFWTQDGQVKLGDFGSFNISALHGDELTLAGNDFVYDPSMGDLMLRIEVLNYGRGGAGGFGGFGFGGGGGGGGGGFAASSGSAGFSAPPSLASPPAFQAQAAPQLALAATVVPEPAAWALMLTGFLGAGATLRRRRRLTTA